MNTKSHCCVYLNCPNKRKTCPELGFFKVPSDKSRQKIWIDNSGNNELWNLSSKEIISKVICEKHFDSKYLMCNNASKKLLVKHAVPHDYSSFRPFTTSPTFDEEHRIIHPVKRVYSNKMLLNKHSPPHSKEEDNDGIIPPKQRRLSTMTYRNLNTLLENKSKDAKTLIKMVVQHSSKKIWSQQEKQLALSYYYKSPSLYNFMRNKSKISLPTQRTIRSWLKINQLRTGLNTSLIKKFKVKIGTMMENERYCVLLFDEMSLKRTFDYNSSLDLIEGFEDLGHLGRNPNVANRGLVFMVRGLFVQWKQSISYYVSEAPLSGDKLKQIIEENIKRCTIIGLNVASVICDQCANNRKAYELLGVTKKDPFFYINTKKIFALYDSPHLIKSIRNNLMLNDIFVDGSRVSWNDIRETYNISKQSPLISSLTKITGRHIYPSRYDKMSVKLATQIFSKSMSTAMNTARKTGDLTSSSAENTVIFLHTLNNVFDALNSRLLNDSNPYRSALSNKNNIVKKTLTEAIVYLESVQIFDRNNVQRENVYCFDGMVQTITGILQLFECVNKRVSTFILTSRLQQYPLENLFSVLRNRGEYKTNPSVKSFRQGLQQNMQIQMLETIGTENCEIDDNTTLDLNIESHDDPCYVENSSEEKDDESSDDRI